MSGALAANRNVLLISFDREVVDDPVYHDPRVRHISLGPIRGGVGVSRLFSVIRATWLLARARDEIKDRDAIVLVNSLELLIMSTLCGITRLPTVYDVSDIHPLQLSGSLAGRVMRWLERLTLRRVRLIVVTSPWFYWEYYRGWLGSTQPAMLIENRIPESAAGPVAEPVFGRRIAWNGLLRCQASAAALYECLRSAPAGDLQLALHGTLDRLGEWGPRLIRERNCEYTGHYTPEQVSGLLVRSSFVWAVDLSEGLNSRWLLPYRIYSALAAGVPVIALAGTATAEVVARHGIGLVLPECTSHAVLETLAACDAAAYERLLRNVRALRECAVRQDEWARALEDTSRWNTLGRLPLQPDVGLVFSRQIMQSSGGDSPRSDRMLPPQSTPAALAPGPDEAVTV